MADINEFFETIETTTKNHEIAPLTTESIVLLLFGFASIGLLLLCLFCFMCCNCIHKVMDEFEFRENIVSTEQSGTPISTKRQSNEFQNDIMTNLRKKNVPKITKNKNNIIFV